MGPKCQVMAGVNNPSSAFTHCCFWGCFEWGPPSGPADRRIQMDHHYFVSGIHGSQCCNDSQMFEIVILVNFWKRKKTLQLNCGRSMVFGPFNVADSPIENPESSPCPKSAQPELASSSLKKKMGYLCMWFLMCFWKISGQNKNNNKNNKTTIITWSLLMLS